MHKYLHPAWVCTAAAPRSRPPASAPRLSVLRGSGLLFKGKELSQASRGAVILSVLCLRPRGRQTGAHACTLCCFSRVRLCDPMDYSPPGSSVHGILRAGILEWVAMPSSRESSQPRDQTHSSCIAGIFFFLTTKPPGWNPPPHKVKGYKGGMPGERVQVL